MKKVIAIILIILAISGIGIGVFFNYQHSRTTMNNDNAVGNTSGTIVLIACLALDLYILRIAIHTSNMTEKYILPTLTITTGCML